MFLKTFCKSLKRLAAVFLTLFKVKPTLHRQIGIVDVPRLFISPCPISPQQVTKDSCREANKWPTDTRDPNITVPPTSGFDSFEIFHIHCLDENRSKKETIAILLILAFCSIFNAFSKVEKAP